MGNSCFAGLSPQSSPRITTGYWKCRGLGAPVRMMCCYVNSPGWEDKQYEVRAKQNGSWLCREWDVDKKELAAHNPLLTLPYVKNQNNGEVVSQSNAVYLYLGRVFELNGRDAQERTSNEQILFYSHNIALTTIDLVYPFKVHKEKGTFVEALAPYFNQQIPEHYRKLEQLLKNGKSSPTFLVGPQPCTCDFHVWEMLDQTQAMAEQYHYDPPLRDFELLTDYYERFRKLERLQRYFESEASRFPIHNKMAYYTGP